MAQHMYGRNREEPYAPSYGYGQGANLVPKAPQQVVETRQAQKKPVVINYFPSGNTNNPQRVIAQVETVTREAVRNPGTVVEPVQEIRSHGDGQLRREDEFVNKLQDDTIKSAADLNDASRSMQPSYIEPKVLSANLDQAQLGDQVVREEIVSRSIQPRDRHGNGTMSDGWSEPHDSADPSHPRKVAELVSRVSNWRGTNGYDRGKPISDGYDKWSNNNPAGGKGYDQIVGYGGDSTYDNSRYGANGGYGSSRGKPEESYTGGRNNNGWNKLPNSPQGYEQVGYGGDHSTNRISPSSKINGSYGSSDEFGYGNRGRPADDGYTRRNDVNPQAPSAGSGYSYIIGSKPPSTQQGYDQYGYNEPRVGYHGGVEGSNKPVATNQLGYGYGSSTEETGYGNRARPTDDGYTRRNGVNSQAPRAGDSYSYTIGSTNKPLSKQEGYDQYGYNEPRVGYNGGGEGSIVKPVASNQLGYGYGVDTGNGYSSGFPRSSYAERPAGVTSGTVMTSVEAVSKYKGTFVPMMKTRREEEAKVLVKI